MPLSIKYIDQLREQNRSEIRDAAMHWNTMCNDRSSDIAKILFTSAAFIIPISFFPLSNFEITRALNYESKMLLTLSWVSLILSLPVGIKNMWDEVKHFENWAKANEDGLQIYTVSLMNERSVVDASLKLGSLHTEYENIVAGIQKKSNDHWIWYQIVFLSMGIIIMAVVAIKFLFR